MLRVADVLFTMILYRRHRRCRGHPERGGSSASRSYRSRATGDDGFDQADGEVATYFESWQNQFVSPTVLQSGRYRLFFFSSDRGEPAHVHVARERKSAKFWLAPVRLEYNLGFPPTELNTVAAIVRGHEAQLLQAWDDYFKSGN